MHRKWYTVNKEKGVQCLTLSFVPLNSTPRCSNQHLHVFDRHLQTFERLATKLEIPGYCFLHEQEFKHPEVQSLTGSEKLKDFANT